MKKLMLALYGINKKVQNMSLKEASEVNKKINTNCLNRIDI